MFPLDIHSVSLRYPHGKVKTPDARQPRPSELALYDGRGLVPGLGERERDAHPGTFCCGELYGVLSVQLVRVVGASPRRLWVSQALSTHPLVTRWNSSVVGL